MYVHINIDIDLYADSYKSEIITWSCVYSCIVKKVIFLSCRLPSCMPGGWDIYNLLLFEWYSSHGSQPFRSDWSYIIILLETLYLSRPYNFLPSLIKCGICIFINSV